MFDRVVLINLDKRKDRLGAFKAKVETIPLIRDTFVRQRAVHGDTVSVPGFFISGGGAWGCRQSHLRVLEDALLDGVDTLLVLEDDVMFCDDFEAKLAAFVDAVPGDWHGLMLGGQDHAEPGETDHPEVVRSLNTQRTHAYAVRGREAIQDLYRLWARCDVHIDHVFGKWQSKWNVYQPVPFLCGQDATYSDISGRQDTVRFWHSGTPIDQASVPITLLVADRIVAERLRGLGFHFGFTRDAVSGRDKGLLALTAQHFPADDLRKWANVIVTEATDRGDTPGIWHPELTEDILRKRMDGTRPVVVVKAANVETAIDQLPELRRAWLASRITWVWRGTGHEMLEGLAHHGFHRGKWHDQVSGLDNGVREVFELPDNLPKIKTVLKQLDKEIRDVRRGKVLIAHPAANVHELAKLTTDHTFVELLGATVGEVVYSFNEYMTTVEEREKAAT